MALFVAADARFGLRRVQPGPARFAIAVHGAAQQNSRAEQNNRMPIWLF